MNETYVKSNSFKKLAFKMDFMRTTFLAIAFLFANLAVAQVNLTYEFTQSSATYVPTVGGTQIIAPGSDDGNSNATDIGFDFVFDGVVYTQFRANANGNIRLGTSTSFSTPISSSTNTGAIAFFARDGLAAGGTFTQLSGTAPNRVLTIDYPTYQLNWGVSAAGNTLDAQIRLFETTNAIEIHYGSSTTATSYTGQVGIRGATAGESNFLNRTSSTDWSATTSGTSSSNTMTLSSTVFPTSGLIFKWMPAPPPVDPPTCVGTFDPASAAMNVVKNPTLTWSGATGFPTSYDVYFGTSTDPAFAVNVPSATTSYVPGLLMANTTYYWKVVPKNDNGDAIDCAVQSFTTGTDFSYCASNAIIDGDTKVGSFSLAGVTKNAADGCVTYTDRTADTPIILPLGAGVPVSITLGTCSSDFYSSYAKVYVDVNQNGTFEDEEMFYGGAVNTNDSGTAGDVTSGTLTVPMSALIGNTRLRLVLREGGDDVSTTACGTYGYGETQDYTVTIAEPTADLPSCIATSSPSDTATDVVRNATLSWSGATGFPTSYDVYFGTAEDPAFVMNVMDASYNPGALMANTTYYWKIVPKNATGDAEGCAVQSFTTGSSFDYCASNATIDGDTKVGSFTLAGMTKDAADGCVTYTDRTADAPFVLQQGVGVPVSVALGTCSFTFYGSYAKVFVDVNQNGTFEDEEMFYGGSLTSSAPGNVTSGTLTLPMSALLGNTRLRLVLRESGSDVSTTACGTYGYGETQDYTVTVIEPLPTTQLRTQFCNTTLTTLNENIYANVKVGASMYKFKVVNGDDEQEITRPDSRFSMGFASGIMAGTPYEVSVATEVGGVWSAYGTACTVTTPMVYPTTQLRTEYCNETLTGLNDNIYADFVVGASMYKFKVVNGMEEQEIERPDSRFSMAFATGIMTGTTYDVSVATMFNGVWSEYGSVCTVTTPAALPTTQLRSSFCNGTVSSLGSNFYASGIVGATAYKFKTMINGEDVEVVRPNARCFMVAFPGAMMDQTYSIEVAVQIGGVWSEYGTACNLTVGTSGVSKQDVSGAAQAFDIKAYPNPFMNQITLSLSNENTQSDIMVYDMTGKLIQQVSTEETSLEIGNDWSKGIYLVQIVQGQETKSIRIVKQ